MGTMNLHTRSFHPRESFGVTGLGFSGDKRGFTTLVDGPTSRIRSEIIVDLQGASINAPQPISDPSTHPLGMSNDYTEDNTKPWGSFSRNSITPYREDGDQSFNLTYAYGGQNHAAVPRLAVGGVSETVNTYFEKLVVPVLDVTISVSAFIDRANGTMRIATNMRGDGFPNAECFILDTAGNPLFLVTHVRVGTATGQLWGNARIKMASSSLVVDWNADDTFGANVDILSSVDHAGDGSPVTIGSIGTRPVSVWNSYHSGRDAVGPAHRRALDDNWGNIGRSNVAPPGRPHVPVGQVSSGRLPGQMGTIAAGDELNALDLQSEMNAMRRGEHDW